MEILVCKASAWLSRLRWREIRPPDGSVGRRRTVSSSRRLALRAILAELVTHSSATCQNTVAAAIHVRTHRSQHALLTSKHKMAKLLVLAVCTSALLQQPARRISLTPRMGVVKPCVEINQ